MTAHLVPCINEQCGALYLRGERSKAGYCPACRRPKTLEKLRNRSAAIRANLPRNTHCKACGAELGKGRRDRQYCRQWECRKHGLTPEQIAYRNRHRPERKRDRRKKLEPVQQPRISPLEFQPNVGLLPMRGPDGKWRKPLVIPNISPAISEQP